MGAGQKSCPDRRAGDSDLWVLEPHATRGSESERRSERVAVHPRQQHSRHRHQGDFSPPSLELSD